MNERIRELAEQAGLYDEKTPEEVPGFTACFEKFAELIVQECANVITETRWHLPPTQQQIAIGIKEHFGVNE
jgi:hypothetical protein